MKGSIGKKYRTAAALLLAVLLLAAGCSSGSSSKSAGSAANTNMAFPAEEAVMDMAVPPAEPAPAPSGRPGEFQSVSGSGTTVGGVTASATAQNTGISRMLIYKANLTMEVEHYDDAYTEIQNLIHLSGGYIVQFSEQTSGAERSGVFTMKVPATDFSGFLERLEELPHKSLQRSMNAQDVSEEYVDLEARLKAKQVVEERYLKYMGDAVRSEDLIRYTNELAAIQEEIERLKGRMRYLEQNVAYSTVELRLYERASKALTAGTEPNLADRMGDAIRVSTNVLVTVAEGILILLAGLIPIAIVTFLIGGPIYLYFRRRKAKTEKNRPLIP